MEKFINRLETFISWPDTALVSAARLSEAGLFYSGHLDTVQCFHCKARISDWSLGDVPLERHFVASPTCSFVLESKRSVSRSTSHHVQNGDNQETDRHKRVGEKDGKGPVVVSNPKPTNDEGSQQKDSNVKIVNKNYSNSGSSLNDQANEGRRGSSSIKTSLDMKLQANRAASFQSTWPSTCPVSVSELVTSGLYYIGPEDRVQCAWCNGRMYRWEIGDTALGEHARHFPQCSFIQEEMSGKPRSQLDKSFEEAQVVENIRKNQAAIQMAEDMGFHKDIIKEALQRFPECSRVTSDQLLDALFDLEGGLNAGDQPQDNETQTSREPLCEPIEQMLAEHLQLEESNVCVVCLEDQVRIVFLPCRHMVCCDECSMALKHCPICRVLIVGTVQTAKD